jgi:hypothetical protein
LLLTFDDANVVVSTIQGTLRDIRRAVFNTFNFKFIANAATVPGAGVDLTPCLVHFTPRFLVPTFPTNIAAAGDKSDLVAYFNLLGFTTAAGAPITAPTTEPALTQFLTHPTNPSFARQLYRTLINNTQSSPGGQGIHFQVNISTTYTTAWNAAAPGNAMKLKNDANRGAAFVNFFGDMVGLDTTLSAVSPADLKTRIRDRIFRRILTSATVA